MGGDDPPYSSKKAGAQSRSGHGAGKAKADQKKINPVNVVYAMTRNVYSWILPSIRSLAEHNPDARVFILAEDDELPFDLPVCAEIINITGQTYFAEDSVNYNSYFKYINLLKVCYPAILPVDKVIHLDTDTIVRESLQPLFDTDLTDKWFAACPEYRGNYRLVGDTYYNAGVLVLNLAQMREDKAQEKMVGYLNASKQPFADQNAFNWFGSNEDKVVKLDVRWNESRVTGFTDNPAIVHFCGDRDWFWNQDLYRTEYLRKYLKPVLFAGTRPLEQCEDLKAVYDAYEGAKTFVQVDPWRRHPEIKSGKYDLVVINEFPTQSPGTCIMIDHGYFGCKLCGLDQAHPYHSARSAELIDYVITAGSGTMRIVVKACGIPESAVKPLGLPRTDAYFRQHEKQSGKKVYFYAPTYRSKEETPLPDINWQWIDDNLTDSEMLWVRPHPMTGKLLQKSYRHIRELSNTEPFIPVLLECDVLITDYSSAMFDGYLNGIPCVLFEPYKGYEETRGMYLDYPDSYCSRYATTEQELIELCRAADSLTETEYKAMETVAGACDGRATERVLNLIRSLI